MGCGRSSTITELGQPYRPSGKQKAKAATLPASVSPVRKEGSATRDANSQVNNVQYNDCKELVFPIASTRDWDDFEVPFEPAVVVPTLSGRTASWSRASASKATAGLDMTDVGKVDSFEPLRNMLVKQIFDERWLDKHQDVGYVCKVPLILFLAGRSREAQKALDIAARLSEKVGSSWEVYQEFAQAPFFWICWAAASLDRKDIARQCFARVCQYMHAITYSGLIQAPYTDSRDYVADLYATAMVCKLALVLDAKDVAIGAGLSLVRATVANGNNMKRNCFCTRWNWTSGLLNVLDKYHGMQQDRFGQLPVLIGFPAAVLLELATRTAGSSASEQFRDCSKSLLGFLKGCQGFERTTTGQIVEYVAVLAKENPIVHDWNAAIPQEAFQVNLHNAEPMAFDQVCECLIWTSLASACPPRIISL